MELLRQTSACGSECGCHTARPSGRIRWIIGTIILVAAAVLVVRAMMKNNGDSADKAAFGFATAPTTTSDTVVGKDISAFSDLNAVAADMNAVFVFLPGKNGNLGKPPTTQMQDAVRTLEAQRYKVGLFTLKTDSRDYDQIAAQISVPGVVAIVKGRGMSAVSGDITETKLIQAFVAALNAGGCGPSGCGPSGCK